MESDTQGIRHEHSPEDWAEIGTELDRRRETWDYEGNLHRLIKQGEKSQAPKLNEEGGAEDTNQQLRPV